MTRPEPLPVWPGVVAALVVLLIVLTLLPLIALTPEPVLAAIVIHALTRALSLEPLQRYFVWRRDRVLAICAVAAVLLLGVLDGLLAAVAISLMLMLRHMSSARSRCSGILPTAMISSTVSCIRKHGKCPGC